MTPSNPVEAKLRPSGLPLTRLWRHLHGRLGITLIGITGIITILLSWPVARITPQVASRITPGMTFEQTVRIIGGPQHFYDAVTGISTDAPFIKGGDRWEWVGNQGILTVTPDQTGRVGTVKFYPAHSVQQSHWRIVVERLSRGTDKQWYDWWVQPIPPRPVLKRNR
jgi:hypothetical protein